MPSINKMMLFLVFPYPYPFAFIKMCHNQWLKVFMKSFQYPISLLTTIWGRLLQISLNKYYKLINLCFLSMNKKKYFTTYWSRSPLWIFLMYFCTPKNSNRGTPKSCLNFYLYFQAIKYVSLCFYSNWLFLKIKYNTRRLNIAILPNIPPKNSVKYQYIYKL